MRIEHLLWMFFSLFNSLQAFVIDHLKFCFRLFFKYASLATSNNWRLFFSPVSRTIEEKALLGSDNKMYGWSNSAMEPLLITRTRSESIIVLSRWAIVSTVHDANWRRIVCWMKLSVLEKNNHVAINRVDMKYKTIVIRTVDQRWQWLHPLSIFYLTVTQHEPSTSVVSDRRRSSHLLRSLWSPTKEPPISYQPVNNIRVKWTIEINYDYFLFHSLSANCLPALELSRGRRRCRC